MTEEQMSCKLLAVGAGVRDFAGESGVASTDFEGRFDQ